MQNNYITFEVSTLGAIMLLRDAMPIVANQLKPEHFFDQRHVLIYEACLDQFREGKPMDVLAVSQVLREKNNLEKAGGSFYLCELVDNCIGRANLKYHAFKIIEAYVLRKIKELSEIAIKKSNSLENPLEVSGELINELVKITSDIIPVENIFAWDYAIELLMKLQAISRTHYEGETTGVNTCFPSLNQMTDGFHPGELIIMAGRPGMGKTTYASSMAVDMSYNKPVMFFSLEMDGENVMKKIFSKESDVDYNNLRRADMNPDEWMKVVGATERMKKMKLIIDENPVHTITTIRASIMRVKGQFPGLSAVYIDQLNFVKPEGSHGTRDQEVGSITRGLKLLAREMKIPIILLSQLNRKVEERPGKIPQLSDLRDSGNIEQDADMVLMMYRPEYYHIDNWEDGSPTKDEAMVIIAKQRNGTTGAFKLIFEGQFSRFRDKRGGFVPPPIDDSEPLPF